MNNLEREIEAVIKSKMVKDRYGDFNLLEGGELESAARSLYHLVMEYTEKGFLAGRSQQSWKTFCKENGLTPTEHPKQKEADQGIGNWQKCPLCIGSGEILATGFIDSGYVRCPTCDGKKIISTLTGQPPTEPDTKEPVVGYRFPIPTYVGVSPEPPAKNEPVVGSNGIINGDYKEDPGK